MSSRKLAFAVAILSVITTLFVGPAVGQFPGGQSPPHPGWILVDDMWLPPEADNGFFEGPTWNLGFVPFSIHPSVSAAHVTSITRAMEDLSAVCGVTFFPRTSQSDYILFKQYPLMANTGNSSVGVSGGEQEIRMGPQFTSKIGILHEIMHALGFRHEQSRPDRDTYVTVNYGNITSNCGISGTESCSGNFDIVSGTPYGAYDFLSIMHYAGNAFAQPLTNTLTCQPAYAAFQNLMGTRQSLSYGDVNGLINYYGATTVIPTVSAINPASIAQGSSNTSVRLFGSGFYQGSLDGSGVLGTQVTVNGLYVSGNSITFISPTILDVVIPAFQLINAGCLTVRAENTFGGLSAPWQLGVSAQAAGTGFWTGGDIGAHMGSAVVGIGDVNGDGHDDVVVGANGVSAGGQQYAGRVSCFSGSNGSTIWSVLGVGHRGNGTSLANCGDVDADGRDDLLDGAPHTFGANPSIGYVFVRRGYQGEIIRTYSTGVINDGFGTAVANAGDVDGDNVPDHLVGIPLANSANLYSGATGNLIRTLSGASGTGFGRAVAGGFDLNIDGIPDQAVGAPNYPAANRGRVYLHSGFNGALLDSFLGDAAGDEYGASVAMVRSATSSTQGLLVVGSPGHTNDRGLVRIHRYSNGTTYPTLTFMAGLTAGDQFGRSVAGASDLDQDGVEDIVIGAPQGASSPGYIRVHSGAAIAAGSSFAPLATRNGFANGDAFGGSVSAAGDTNGDGVPDLIVGAYNSSYGGCLLSGYANTVHFIVPPSQNKLLLTEVCVGQPAGVELTNFGPPASLAGFRIVWDDGTRHVSLPIPAGFSLGTGRSLLISESIGPLICPCNAQTFFPEAPAATPYFVILPSISVGTQPFTVGLLAPNGLVIDEVRFTPTSGFYSLVGGGVGGYFRSKALRPPSALSMERIGNLDSNSAGDWTAQTSRSFGLENRNSGTSAPDTIPMADLRLNEIDSVPEYVELFNASANPVDLRSWFLSLSSSQNSTHVRMDLSVAASLIIPSGGYAVIGAGLTQPAELPSGVPYLLESELSGLSTAEFELALYDPHGRLVDLVRAASQNSQLVHNFPRAPAPFGSFGGAAPKLGYGSGATGRVSSSIDTDRGSDWRPIHVRSMGTSNLSSTYGGLPGLGDQLDVRLNDTALGGGLTIIINAGPTYAGHRYSFFVGLGHQGGFGPLFGLGVDALVNYLALSNTPPWFGFLDGQGSARVDLAPGSFPPGAATDNIFILQDSSGAVVLRTAVIEFDS